MPDRALKKPFGQWTWPMITTACATSTAAASGASRPTARRRPPTSSVSADAEGEHLCRSEAQLRHGALPAGQPRPAPPAEDFLSAVCGEGQPDAELKDEK